MLTLLLLGCLLIASINIYVIGSSQSRIFSLDHLDRVPEKFLGAPVLVLGAGVIDNALPSQVLANRLDATLAWNQFSEGNCVIVSGDHLEDNYNEVEVMKNYLVEKGIQPEHIYQDHLGLFTYASLLRYKEIRKQDQVVIVSQPYHLYRAIMIAQSLGLDPIGIAAQDTSSTRLQRESREVLARVKDFSFVHFHYPSQEVPREYLINLDQSGDLSHRKSNW